MILIAESLQGPNEKRLLNHLFDVNGYNKLERPVRVEKDPLVVEFSLVIQQIIDMVGLRYHTSVLRQSVNVNAIEVNAWSSN